LENRTKLIFALIGQLFFDWVGFQFLDEAKRLFQSPATAQGYLGLIAIIFATIIACYLFYHGYKWVKAANQAMQGIKTKQESTKPAGSIHVESGTMITPRSGEPVIVTSSSSDLEVYTRAELEQKRSLEAFLSQATKEVVIVGLSLLIASRGRPETFKRLIQKRGIELTCLVLNPESDLVSRMDRELGMNAMKGDIEQTLTGLCALKSQLSEAERTKLEIKTYDSVPILGMIILDPYEPNAKMQIGTYLHGTDTDLRFAITCNKTDREDVFQAYLRYYEMLKSKPYECPYIDNSFGAIMNRAMKNPPHAEESKA